VLLCRIIVTVGGLRRHCGQWEGREAVLSEGGGGGGNQEPFVPPSTQAWPTRPGYAPMSRAGVTSLIRWSAETLIRFGGR
jgi:hypothetical protein